MHWLIWIDEAIVDENVFDRLLRKENRDVE